MSRACFDDFVRGTVTPLAMPGRKAAVRWDVVRPNDDARQLVSRHVQALMDSSRRRTAVIASELAT